MADEDLCYLSAVEAIKAFKSRRLSPVELMQAVIARTEAVEPRVNAFTYTFFDRALEQAKQAETKYAKDARVRPLDGLAVCIKDENTIKGERTTSGSLTTKDNIDTYTSLSVERIMRAGAIVHARSTAPEFACAAVTHSKRWGVTRNPWNLEYTPGGSSGGSGASLAAGTTTIANGSDIAGSIRIPASASGVMGFKPPYGRVPEDSPFNLDWYCHEGPMARTIPDLALLENVMAGPHPQDISTVRPKLRIPDKLGEVKGWKVAYSMDLGYFEVDPEVVANTEVALQTFRDLGATVEEVDLGWTLTSLTAAMHHYGQLFGTYVARRLPRYRHMMNDYSVQFAELAARTSQDDFLTAIEVANEMYQTLGPLLEKYKVLLCPTLSIPAVKAHHDPSVDRVVVNGVEVDPIFAWCMTYPFNMLSRCPVISIPSGHATNDVPTGLQIVGRTYDDVSVFTAAAAFERVHPRYDVPERRPRL